MARFSVVFLLIAAVLVGAAPRGSAAEGTRPNVLMICVDDLNDWLGCLGGHPQALTPHIDALAARGRLFSNAHCSVPVCSASRVSIFSGLHPTSHGSYELGPGYTEIPALAEVPTMHAYFKEHGYLTITGGKVLHGKMGGRLAEDIDRTIGSGRGGPRPEEALNWKRGPWDWGEFPPTDDEMFDLRLALEAAEVLREDHADPFFLTVGFFRPHVPLYVPPRWFGLYDREAITLPDAPADDMDDVPPNFQYKMGVAPTIREIQEAGKWRGLVHAYLASISFADHCVGEVMAGLDEGPHGEDTIVVLWSDHGFHLGEKQHIAKRTLWEESTHVPLIISGQGIAAGEPTAEPASLLDLYPTLLELCDLPENDRLEGISLKPQLDDPSASREVPALTSSYFGNHALRSRDWRYIRYADGAEELYDHRNDPAEHTNLAVDPSPAHAEIIADLSAYLPDDSSSAPEVKPLEKQEQHRQRPAAAEDVRR